MSFVFMATLINLFRTEAQQLYQFFGQSFNRHYPTPQHHSMPITHKLMAKQKKKKKKKKKSNFGNLPPTLYQPLTRYDWTDWLPMAECCFKKTVSTSTKLTPFFA
ncbi:hypothetical protein CROQUDRAFT_467589 [Cronartium quercuum f. sp. fusiforme G11]|uniref:Uncharacterized protein n=1 Tax=Cronartium quercuum f. sp. fusiforme G11 TaxID=708437 RepID=A0A9P6TGJ2_9BASI|nr:hypothetical protein CROQUDRAFT_467589 [Cronartium quercuum f. sp. fusiforme G11]